MVDLQASEGPKLWLFMGAGPNYRQAMQTLAGAFPSCSSLVLLVLVLLILLVLLVLVLLVLVLFVLLILVLLVLSRFPRSSLFSSFFLSSSTTLMSSPSVGVARLHSETR